MKTTVNARLLFCGALCLGLSPFARAQGIEQLLKSFGLPGAANPRAPLVQGRGGALYGTTSGGGTNGVGTVFKVNPDGTGYAVLYSFASGADGALPADGLAQGGDGALYGTTQRGGTNDYGTVFKINPDGTGYTQLYNFTGLGGDGIGPTGGLIQGSDGALYGTTEGGGTNSSGIVYKLHTDGSGYSVLHHFNAAVGDGGSPNGLVQGSDGALYGTTFYGGTNDIGTVFKLETNGAGYTVLYEFASPGPFTADPNSRLVQGIDGALYGTTQAGGTNRGGTVFKINTDGADYTVLYAFGSISGDGSDPQGGLIQGTDGALYGTTVRGGGTNGWGTVFRLNTNGTGYTQLHSFNDLLGYNASPQAGLIQASNGALYGTTYLGGTNQDGTVFKIDPIGTGFVSLYSFTGNGQDGSNPQGGLIQGSDGALYGTTPRGGTGGSGAVFKIRPDGSDYTLLYNFTGVLGDGVNPYAGLVQASDGALYGTTQYGGTNANGTVYKLNTDGGGYSVLYSFTGTGGDGALPLAGLIQGGDGALYGTTWQGGISNAGTIFKINANGTGYTQLYSFRGESVFGVASDGALPQAGLVQGSDGALYGTTSYGGTNGSGTVFKLNPDGSGYTLLHSFTGLGGDGASPAAGLVQASDGALYGTTFYGGTNGDGTVYKLNTDGSGYTLLHSFTALGGDGAGPLAGLVQASDGALYGTTWQGGVNVVNQNGDVGYGTVFKLSTNGADYTSLYSFTGVGGDGAEPFAGLVQGRDGALYGTTMTGGYLGGGTVFRFVSPPLIVTPPQSQAVREGSTLSLSVLASGVPAPSYQWRFNGRNLRDCREISGATTDTLTIPHVRAEDAGSYTVVVNNPYGSVTSAAAVVTVTPRHPPLHIGHSLAVTNGGPDGVPPLVILGEYSPAGPSAMSPIVFPAAGRVTAVDFYGSDYHFTLYALRRLGGGARRNEQTFRVLASQSFSGSAATPSIQSLPVSDFLVEEGDLLAFAGIGPWYPQNPNDGLHSDATYENSSQPVGYDNDTATPPGGPGTIFTVGRNRDRSATYGYIADNLGNQGRVYAIAVDVLITKEIHDHRRFDGRDDDGPDDQQPPSRDWEPGRGDHRTGNSGHPR